MMSDSILSKYAKKGKKKQKLTKNKPPSPTINTILHRCWPNIEIELSKAEPLMIIIKFLTEVDAFEWDAVKATNASQVIGIKANQIPMRIGMAKAILIGKKNPGLILTLRSKQHAYNPVEDQDWLDLVLELDKSQFPKTTRIRLRLQIPEKEEEKKETTNKKYLQ